MILLLFKVIAPTLLQWYDYYLGTFVILHLYQNYIEKCNLINQHMNTLAKEYTDIKFTKILSTRCIENFPDSNLPCVIIYKNGELFKNIPNFDKLNLT